MRKILIETGGPEHSFFWGLANAFQSMNYQVGMLDATRFSVFDAFNRFQPDVFICRDYRITRGVEKCLLAWSNKDKVRPCKFVLFEEKPTEGYWKIITRDRIDLSCSVYSGHGLQILPAVDTVRFNRGKVDDAYVCDYAFVGDFQEWMRPYFDILVKHNINFRIYSSTPCDVPNNVGYLNDHEIPIATASAKSCIDFSKNISEEFLRIIYCGVSNNSLFFKGDKKEELFPGLKLFDSPESFELQLTASPTNGYNSSKVLTRHTYNTRVLAILSKIN